MRSMLMRSPFLVILFLLAHHCLASFTQPPVTRTLHIAPTATVGDLFSVDEQNGTTLYFPDCAYFRFSYDKKNLQNQRLFYTTPVCRMPIECFVQFMKNGHTLFHDKKIRRAYAKAVNAATRVQRHVNRKPTETALSRLKNAKQDMFNMLKTLPLSDAKVRASLEKILSIKPATLPEQLKSPLKAGLKFIGKVCAGIAWVFSCCVVGAGLTNDGRGMAIAGLYGGFYFGLGSIVAWALYGDKISKSFSQKNDDIFQSDETSPVTIQIELDAAPSTHATPQETLDLKMTSTQSN